MLNVNLKEFKLLHQKKQNQIIYVPQSCKGNEAILNLIDNLERAKQMVYDAYNSGCECVKFQYHIAEHEMNKSCKNIKNMSFCYTN